jgi:hypothetical protein
MVDTTKSVAYKIYGGHKPIIIIMEGTPPLRGVPYPTL